MNEFLSCTRKGRVVEVYYEEFVKLSRHAPLMSEEQKLSRFILGLEGRLAAEVESLRPTSLADALIRAQSKLSSFQLGVADEARKRSFPPLNPYRPPKAPYVQPSTPVPHPPIPVAAHIQALPVTLSERENLLVLWM